MAVKLEFDTECHTYRLDGTLVPSVTQILDDLLPFYAADEWYLQRGKAVHACAALEARGAEYTYTPQLAGYVQALRLFFRECRVKPIAIEKQVASRRHGYAGTLDLCASLDDQTPELLDYKSGAVPKSVCYQLAGYGLAYQEMGHIAVRHGRAVQIRQDGTYRLSETYDLRRYRAGWLALLGAHNIRRECRLTQWATGDEIDSLTEEDTEHE